MWPSGGALYIDVFLVAFCDTFLKLYTPISRQVFLPRALISTRTRHSDSRHTHLNSPGQKSNPHAQHASHTVHVESSAQTLAMEHSDSTHASHVAWSAIQSTQHASHAVHVESFVHTAAAGVMLGTLVGDTTTKVG